MRNAGIYVRVSTERQAHEGYSVAAQKENLTKFAQDNDFRVYEVYADEGISGKNVEGRPSVKKLIKDIQDGKIDVVLIQKFDRLTRNISDTEDFIQLFQQYDVDIWSISDGKVDISNSNGKFMTLLKGLFAQLEREQTSERIKVAFSQKARQGYTLCCGCTPYGYNREKGNKVIVINKEEAKVVKRIFKMYAEGTSFTTIARTLINEGVPTKNAGKTVNIRKNNVVVGSKTFVGVWLPKSVKLILSNPVYIGKVRYGIGRKDYYIGEGKHQPIISEKLWNKVQDKLNKIGKKVHTNRPKDDVYFCGTLVCGICGKKLTTSRTIGRLKKDGTRNLFNSYRCVNQEKGICTARYISHNKVEEAFITYLKNNVEAFDAIDDLVIEEEDVELEEIDTIKKLIVSKRAKQKEVMDLFMVEKLDYKSFKYMNDELDSIIKENEAKLNTLVANHNTKPAPINKDSISKHIVDHWQNLTGKEKFEFLNEFVESIVIVNRSPKRNSGKAEIMDIKFYDYEQGIPSEN